MFALEDAVWLNWSGERQAGEVVRVREVASRRYYDVSLEHVVVKAVSENELSSCDANDLRNMLRLLMGPHAVPASEREAIMRQAHVEFLTRALSTMQRVTSDEDAAMAYAVGTQVALRNRDALLLGVVRGMLKRADKLLYEVAALGDVELAAEEDLQLLPSPDSGRDLCLGARARMVVAGHESDDDYTGVICMVQEVGNEPEFALMFDDGDILEGLGRKDLALA